MSAQSALGGDNESPTILPMRNTKAQTAEVLARAGLPLRRHSITNHTSVATKRSTESLPIEWSANPSKNGKRRRIPLPTFF
jgi:hypothetical protein